MALQKKGTTRSIQGFANHEIVTLAVYLLGGESQTVDTEDVAIKTNKIAPGRFAWRKYPEQINLESVRKRLWDARDPEKGGYMVGSEKEGWQLTEKGVEFARLQIAGLHKTNLSRKPMNQKEKVWFNRERARMLTSEAFLKFQMGGAKAVTGQEAEAFFHLDDYVIGKARERKVLRTLNTFGDDPELGGVVKELAEKVRGGK